jgi:ElaB/YqjD/DUF883 family membrane-anchored ribosome-binding protein
MFASAKKENMVQDSKALLDDTEALLREAAKASGDKAQELYDRIAENLNKAKTTLLDAQANITEKAKETAKNTDQYVHDHPWQAVGAAAAIGAVLGMLIARK